MKKVRIDFRLGLKARKWLTDKAKENKTTKSRLIENAVLFTHCLFSKKPPDISSFHFDKNAYGLYSVHTSLNKNLMKWLNKTSETTGVPRSYIIRRALDLKYGVDGMPCD